MTNGRVTLGRGAMYTVFTRDSDGEFLFVASRDNLTEAVQLAEELHANWPHEYVVRDSSGNNTNVQTSFIPH
jgi:hypothetical protein